MGRTERRAIADALLGHSAPLPTRALLPSAFLPHPRFASYEFAPDGWVARLTGRAAYLVGYRHCAARSGRATAAATTSMMTANSPSVANRALVRRLPRLSAACTFKTCCEGKGGVGGGRGGRGGIPGLLFLVRLEPSATPPPTLS